MFFRSITNMKERSSRPEVFCKKDVLRNFAKFTGKYLRQSLFFNKVQAQPYNFIKKETKSRALDYNFIKKENFVKFLRTPFFIEHLWWMFLERILVWMS